MKYLTNFCIITFLLLQTQSAYSQKKSNIENFYFDIEWVTLGSEFMSGEISDLLKPGIHVSSCNFNVGIAKIPSFTLGLTLLDSGSHDFAATETEEGIIDNYMIIKTTTDRYGNSTTETEQLEKIRLTRFNFGLPVSFVKLSKTKPINYQISLIPTLYNFSTNIPKEGVVQIKDKAKFGIGLKAAVDYDFMKWKKKGRYLRLSYNLYSIPDLDMSLLPGMRKISGTGLAHAIQIGFGFRTTFHKTQK